MLCRKPSLKYAVSFLLKISSSLVGILTVRSFKSSSDLGDAWRFGTWVMLSTFLVRNSIYSGAVGNNMRLPISLCIALTLASMVIVFTCTMQPPLVGLGVVTCLVDIMSTVYSVELLRYSGSSKTLIDAVCNTARTVIQSCMLISGCDSVLTIIIPHVVGSIVDLVAIYGSLRLNQRAKESQKEIEKQRASAVQLAETVGVGRSSSPRRLNSPSRTGSPKKLGSQLKTSVVSKEAFISSISEASPSVNAVDVSDSVAYMPVSVMARYACVSVSSLVTGHIETVALASFVAPEYAARYTLVSNTYGIPIGSSLALLDEIVFNALAAHSTARRAVPYPQAYDLPINRIVLDTFLVAEVLVGILLACAGLLLNSEILTILYGSQWIPASADFAIFGQAVPLMAINGVGASYIRTFMSPAQYSSYCFKIQWGVTLSFVLVLGVNYLAESKGVSFLGGYSLPYLSIAKLVQYSVNVAFVTYELSSKRIFHRNIRVFAVSFVLVAVLATLLKGLNDEHPMVWNISVIGILFIAALVLLKSIVFKTFKAVKQVSDSHN